MKKRFLLAIVSIPLLIFTSFKFLPITQEADTNRELVKKFHQVWSSGRIGQLKDLISSDFYCHFNAGSDWQGITGTGEKITGLRKAFPDWNEEIVDMVAENDKVVTRYKSTATHQGKFIGFDSTGRKISIFEISIYRIANGKIVEQWCFADRLSLLQQLQPDENLLRKLEPTK